MSCRLSVVLLLLIGCTAQERTLAGKKPLRTPGDSFEWNQEMAPSHPRGASITSTRHAGRPFAIAVSRDSVIYCTLLDSARVVQAGWGSDSVGSVAVGAVPTDIALSPAGTRAYVTNQFGHSLSVVDTKLRRQVEVFAVDGDPYRVVVGPEGQRVYVTTNLGAVLQIEPETHRVAWSLPLGGNLNGLAIDLTQERIYVGNVTGILYELTSKGDVVRALQVPGSPQGLALSSDGRELYIAGEAGDFIVIDLASWSETARTRLGADGFGIAVTPDQSQVWITSPTSGDVFVIDRGSRNLIRTIGVGGKPRRITFDRSGATAVIANEAGTIDLVH